MRYFRDKVLSIRLNYVMFAWKWKQILTLLKFFLCRLIFQTFHWTWAGKIERSKWMPDWNEMSQHIWKSLLFLNETIDFASNVLIWNSHVDLTVDSTNTIHCYFYCYSKYLLLRLLVRFCVVAQPNDKMNETSNKTKSRYAIQTNQRTNGWMNEKMVNCI